MDVYNVLNRYLNPNIRQALNNRELLDTAEEIRIRQNKPLVIKKGNENFFMKNGNACSINEAFRPQKDEIQDTLSRMCEYSPYAYNDEIRRGFITLEGGFRVGLAGTAVECKDGISTIKYINSLNIRISRELWGCADKVMKYVYGNTLIISPPGCGKTTILRDIIRQISNQGINISVVDERCEISGIYLGNIQFDLGICTDVLCCYSKSIGMNMMLRSMAPKIIAVDEIGSNDDILAIHNLLNSGVKIIATIHCNTIENILQKPFIENIVKEKIFDSYIILNNNKKTGELYKIYDKELNIVWQ